MSAQYFAQINDNKICIYVAVVNKEFLDANPDRYTGTWVETFINDTHVYAGVGYTYDEATQDFIAPYVEPIEPIDGP